GVAAGARRRLHLDRVAPAALERNARDLVLLGEALGVDRRQVGTEDRDRQLLLLGCLPRHRELRPVGRVEDEVVRLGPGGGDEGRTHMVAGNDLLGAVPGGSRGTSSRDDQREERKQSYPRLVDASTSVHVTPPSVGPGLWLRAISSGKSAPAKQLPSFSK